MTLLQLASGNVHLDFSGGGEDCSKTVAAFLLERRVSPATGKLTDNTIDHQTSHMNCDIELPGSIRKEWRAIAINKTHV